MGCSSANCPGGGTFIVCSYDIPGTFNGQSPYEKRLRSFAVLLEYKSSQQLFLLSFLDLGEYEQTLSASFEDARCQMVVCYRSTSSVEIGILKDVQYIIVI